MSCPNCQQNRLVPETAMRYQGHPPGATLHYCADCSHLLLLCPGDRGPVVDLSAFNHATHGPSLEAWVREQLAQPA